MAEHNKKLECSLIGLIVEVGHEGASAAGRWVAAPHCLIVHALAHRRGDVELEMESEQQHCDRCPRRRGAKKRRRLVEKRDADARRVDGRASCTCTWRLGACSPLWWKTRMLYVCCDGQQADQRVQ